VDDSKKKMFGFKSKISSYFTKKPQKELVYQEHNLEEDQDFGTIKSRSEVMEVL